MFCCVNIGSTKKAKIVQEDKSAAEMSKVQRAKALRARLEKILNIQTDKFWNVVQHFSGKKKFTHNYCTMLTELFCLFGFEDQF